jgi:beta-1,4-N-acetylglucosaminyltransferase
MIQLLKSMISLEPRYAPRCYIVAETDAMSGKKAAIFEHQDVSQYSISYIPRSREVGQKYITSIFTTLWALLYAGIVVLRHRPRVLLVNGPGTCLPLVVWCRLASFSGLIFHGCKVIYVESIARVDHLSLTGRIIYNLGLAHCFYVQWEELQAKLPRSLYVGRVY